MSFNIRNSREKDSVKGKEKNKGKEKENEREDIAEPGNNGPQGVEVEEDEIETGIQIGDIYVPPPPPSACSLDNTGPRLIITHIENEFFKSYAGRQVLGPFHKNFTSIVGPNGSGKSNIIDSMLFVFGYRATKIRSKKISVLIHDSEQHQNVQSCKVSVHFQKIIDKDSDDFEVVPDSHFVVSRTAFRDNSSFYQINGKKCQFKAVSRQLRAHGIDLDHSRFLILQGEVEQIAMMKPKAVTEHDTGMLEFIEDIIGSSRLKEPIEMLFKRVEDLNEARREKLNRVKLVEEEKEALEGPKDKAVEHLRLENEVTSKKHTLFQCYYLDCSRRKEKAEGKKQEIDEGMSEVKKELEEINAKKREKEEEIKKLGENLEKISKIKEECSEKFKALENEDVKMQEDLKHKNQRRKKLMSQQISEKSKLEELGKVPEKNEKDIEECQKLKDDLENERKKEETAYHEVISTLNSETQQLQDEKTKFETCLVDLRKEVDEAKSALDIAQCELNIYQSTEQNEKRKLEHILAGLEKAQDTIHRRTEEITMMEDNVPKSEEQLKNDMQNLQHLIPEQQKIEEQLRIHRVKLEETRSAMQSSRSRGTVLDAIMGQRNNGSITGVFGRLGDLGGIDAKYDVAISTACGPLDNIVVDSVDTGEKCINFLKTNNIGTATFIALDKMEKWRSQCEMSIQTPENVPRLFDLVRLNDDKLKTAFYFALRDTLVADDLDQASRIAYGRVRHRVVTLKGELIEPSGTMSGGGRSVLRGRMGKQAAVLNVDTREVELVEGEVEKLTQHAGQLRKERAQLEDSIQQLTKDLKMVKLNIQKYRLEIEAAHQQLVSLQDQKGRQEEKVNAVKPDPTKIKKMENNIEEKMKIYKVAAASAQEVETQVNKIHQQIMEITEGKMKILRKSVDSVKKKLEKVDAEIIRLQVGIKTAKRNSKKTEEKVAGMEAEILELQNELLELQTTRTSIEGEAAQVLEHLQSLT
ncbi:structural maintenance of chromosomes protein 4-like, partial [Cherax quadricarinatus]